MAQDERERRLLAREQADAEDRKLDPVRLRLGGGESCLRVEARRLSLTTAELKRRLYGDRP